MTPVASLRDLGQRYALVHGPARQEVRRLWRDGHLAVAIRRVEDLVPEPQPQTVAGGTDGTSR